MNLLTEAEISNFWKDRDQMSLDKEVVQGLLSEYIVSPLDLVEFEKE